jgi:uncharacterized protein with HEPN domain
VSRDWRLYLTDLNEAAAKVVRYTIGMDQAAFLGDDKTRDAVLRNLEIIGEAAKNLPSEVLARYPAVEWRRISGFRDIVAHAYFGIDNTILVEIVFSKVPELIAAIGQKPEPN